jgi:hypothetical protein
MTAFHKRPVRARVSKAALEARRQREVQTVIRDTPVNQGGTA